MRGRIAKWLAAATLMLSVAACASAGPASVGGGVSGAGASAGRGLIEAGRADPAPFVSGTMRAYEVRGRRYQPREQPAYEETGMASWYGDAFNGRPTATGERFDMSALTAAHKTLPLPCLVEVTNLANGRSLVIRVNDRGPFVDGRIIDLSRGSAQELGLLDRGVGEVRVRYVGPAPRLGGEVRLQRAEAAPQPLARADTPGDYWIQAGAFSDRRTASQIVSRLGDRARLDETRSNGQRLFRVIVGPWDDANAAETARQAVIARGYPDALLISAR